MNDDITLKEIKDYVDFAKDVIKFVDLNPEKIKSLFSYICVKDLNNKWHELSYGNNYNITFAQEGIYIEVFNYLYDEDSNKIPFKPKYLIRTDSCFELDENIVFSKYTGYDKVLNGESKDIINN